MDVSRVIKVPRDDETSTYVLIQVIQEGPKPLDVKLVGTEGEEPYVATLKHEHTASLRVQNCPVSKSEWQAILQSLFALQPTADIQATARVKSSSSLSITVRKRVQGITQRLGSIELKHKAREAIELFEWCAGATDALEKSNVALTEAAAHAKDLENTVKELKSQLDELITSKQDDETALLIKFRDLLNEKKVKIREQQKIIAAGPVQSAPSSSSQRLSQPSESQPPRKPTTSRPRKRKAQAQESSSNDAEEAEMEVDKIKVEPQDSEQEETAQETASGGSDDDDDESDDGDVGGDKSESGVGSSSGPAPKAPPPPKKAAETPPAPRNLPFASKEAAATKAPVAEEETESDDEL